MVDKTVNPRVILNVSYRQKDMPYWLCPSTHQTE